MARPRKIEFPIRGHGKYMGPGRKAERKPKVIHRRTPVDPMKLRGQLEAAEGQKFQVGELVRIGKIKDYGGRNPYGKGYSHLRPGRIVRVKAVVDAPWLGEGHLGYVIAGRRGYGDSTLASYELRKLEERGAAGRPRKYNVQERWW